jgi:hypothetical protein
MSAEIDLENSFDVRAPAANVWDLLNDPYRVVPCLPGAELVEVRDPDDWRGLIRVAFGPIKLNFEMSVRRSRVDGENRSVRLTCDAREANGRGGAVATVDSSLSETGDGATRVALASHLALDGAVAEVAAGPLVADVSRQLTRRFAQSLARALEAGPDQAPPPPLPEPIGGLRIGLGAIAGTVRRGLRRLARGRGERRPDA